MAEKFLTQEQLSVFCSSLAMLLRSGASLSEVSSLFEEDDMDTALRQTSTEISRSVAAGETFSAAAEKTGVFPEYALSVFSTAELSGRLDEALDRLADHYDRQSALYDRLRSTLTYPAVLMLMICGVLAVLVFVVLPMFERVYDNLTGSLLSSSYAYVLAATLIGRISLVFAGLLGIVLAFGMRSDKGREKLRNTMETSRFTRKAAWLLAPCLRAVRMKTVRLRCASSRRATKSCTKRLKNAVKKHRWASALRRRLHTKRYCPPCTAKCCLAVRRAASSCR